MKVTFLSLVVCLGFSTVACAQGGDSLVHDCWEPYYLYKGDSIIGRVTTNRYWTMSMEMPVENVKPYSVERGTFKDKRLWNGSVEYINENGQVIKKAAVKNGVSNEKVIVLSDSAFLFQVHTYSPKIDLNENGTIEEGEMLAVHYLKIRSENMKSPVDLFKFTALETLIIDDHYFKGNDLLDKVKFEESFSALIATNEANTYYDFVKNTAEFPGGQEKFFEFINTNLVFPDSTEIDDIIPNVKVYVEFIVEMDGELSNFQVLRTNSDAMGKAVIAALKKSPKWVPATLDGKAVRQRMVLPVVIALQ